MTAPLVFALLLNVLALVFTLSVFLLVIWRDWQSHTGQAMLQFVGSLALFQAGTFLTHFGLLVEFEDFLVEGLLTFTLLCFALVALTALALLLHAANAMKEAWLIFCRAGVVGLIVLQPAIWQRGVLRLPDTLNEDLFGSPYTDLGKVAAVTIAGYLGLALLAGWRYWRQIDAPLLTGSIVATAITQLGALAVAPLRELSLTAAVGGVASGIIGYHLFLQFERDPRSTQAVWSRAWHDVSQTITGNLELHAALTTIAEHIRQLARVDGISVLSVIGPDRLELTAVAGLDPTIVGRHIRIGEGVAGRVMQTSQPMRVANYRAWSGRAADFEDLPLYATMSVPLIYNTRLIGVLNAHETSPGRTFADRDQVTLELLAPQATITIVKAHLEHQLYTTRTYFEALMANTTNAVMIFDSMGLLQAANSPARRYLHALFGDMVVPPTVIQLAARAQNDAFTSALVKWTAHSDETFELETTYKEIGRLVIQLQTITNEWSAGPELLLIMQTQQNRT